MTGTHCAVPPTSLSARQINPSLHGTHTFDGEGDGHFAANMAGDSVAPNRVANRADPSENAHRAKGTDDKRWACQARQLALSADGDATKPMAMSDLEAI